jgi:hypothetical protein
MSFKSCEYQLPTPQQTQTTITGQVIDHAGSICGQHYQHVVFATTPIISTPMVMKLTTSFRTETTSKQVTLSVIVGGSATSLFILDGNQDGIFTGTVYRYIPAGLSANMYLETKGSVNLTVVEGISVLEYFVLN